MQTKGIIKGLGDSATDDNTAIGNFRTGTVCAGQDENIPVDNAVLKLN